MQVACVGLLKAIDRFDPGARVAFAASRCRPSSASCGATSATGAVVRARATCRSARCASSGAAEELTTASGPRTDRGGSPTLGLSVEDVLEGLRAGRGRWATSLAAPAPRARTSIGDHLGCGDHGFELAEHRAVLERLLGALDDRERRVLRLRFEDGPHAGGDRAPRGHLADARLAAAAPVAQKLRLEAATVRR